MPKYFTGVYAATQVLSNPTTDNPATVTSAGIIAVANADGIYGTNAAAWQLTNFGKIADAGTAGSGVHLTAGGSVTNGPSGFSQALIAGGADGVAITGSAGAVSNYGTITASASLGAGVYLGAGGTVRNFATIGDTVGGGATAINLSQGGMVFNALGASLDASGDAVVISGASGTVTNDGQIGGGTDGVVLTATDATLTNSGMIFGTSRYGVYLSAGGSATNTATGVIQGYYGIGARNSAANVVNLGTIASTGADADGVRFAVAGSTLTNAGMIIAGSNAYGAQFTGAGNLLIIDPGAVFSGFRAAAVHGDVGGVGNTVELAAAGSTGTISGIGSNYVGFDTVTVDAGANWVLNGTNTLAAGGTLSDFGTLTNLGTLLGSGGQLIVDPATFVNSGYVNTAVTLAGGSTLDNTQTGTIVAAGTAVLGINSPNTVANAGTLVGSSGYGIQFSAGGIVSNASTGFISGGTSAIEIQGSAGDVVNFGTIADGPGGLAAVNQANGDTVFDTTPSWNGTSAEAPFGSPDTATYGQSFVAPADNVLQSFTFYLEGSATLQFQAQVYAWSGNLLGGNAPQGATGPALFTSAPITFGPTGGVFTPVTVNTGGVTLTAGGHYIALFTISGPDPTDFTNSSGTDVWGDIYPTHVANDGGGGFNFDNNNSNFAALTGSPWDDGFDGGDSAWTATFTAGVRAGVDLAAGGNVTNAAGGLIEGESGVLIGDSAGSIGTVVNAGTIESTASSGAGAGVYLGQGGVVSNHAGGLITANLLGVDIAGSAGTVVNFGTIASTATGAVGIYLQSGGVIANEAGALVSAQGTAISLGGTTGVAANVTNLGTLTGNIGISINVADTGNNTIDNFGVITGTGGTAINLLGGADLVVLEKGSALSGAIGNFAPGDTLDLVSVPFSTGDTVSFSGTTLTVSGGGVTELLTLTGISGAADFILSSGGFGGVDVGVVSSGSNVVVSSGQILTVLSGQIVSGVTVESGGVLDVASGGTISAATIQGGGLETVSAGGVDSGATVSSGGFEDVFGSANATLIVGAGSQTVESGGHTTGTVLDNAALQIVSSGGVAISTIVGATDSQVILSGGVASATLVNGGGTEIVSSGGLDISATISGGGFEDVFGSASGTLVVAGGSQTVEAGGTTTGTVLDALNRTITFDDLPPGDDTPIPNGYQGFNWNNFDVLDGVTYANPSGYVNGTVSPPNVAFNDFGNPASFSVASGTFTAGSFYLTAAWNNGLNVQVEGLLNGQVIDDTTFIVNATGGPTLETVNWSGINELYFDSFGGTNVGYPGAGEHFALDNLTIGATGAIQTVSSGGTASFTVVGSGDEQIVLSGGTAIGTNDQGLVVVSSGGLASAVTASAGGTLDLFGGGNVTSGTLASGGVLQIDSDATVELAGAALQVQSGGATIGAIADSGGAVQILSGGSEGVAAGATASSTTVFAGGSQTVSAGGVDSGATVSGGTLTVLSGGSAIATSDGGTEIVSSGGSDSGATIAGSGFEDVFGSASGTLILAGGSLTVEAGGIDILPTIGSGGTENVFGIASGAVVSSSGTQDVKSGGIAISSVLLGITTPGGNGVQNLSSGGTATATTISSGGQQNVSSGGTASGTVVNSGGREVVSAGGVDGGATISSGGFEDVFGSAVATLVLNGGSQTVEAGGSVTGAVLDGAGVQSVFGFAGGTVVSAGDEQVVEPGGAASGTVISSGGSEVVFSGGLTSDTTIAGGFLELQSGAAADGTIAFAGSGALQLDSLTPPAATIAGLASGDTIDLRAIGFGSATSAAFDAAAATLTVSGGGVSETLSLAAGTIAAGVILGSDGAGGTDAQLLLSASGLVLSAGQTLTIPAGGTASGVSVLSGATLDIASGGEAIGTVISSGGQEVVFSGGIDSAATIASGGSEDVFGSAAGTLVLNGGSQTVEAGGVVTGAMLDGVGLQLVFGFAGGTVVGAGDEQLVEPGGVASATTVSSGGQEIVAAGGLDIGATISGGGFEDVFGSASATLIVGAGSQTVESGGHTTGTVLDNAALQIVSSGGVAISTIVGATDSQVILSGGVASATLVNGGGTEIVSSGGLDIGATISGGGFEDVFGSASGTLVVAGGSQTVEAGGTTTGTVLDALNQTLTFDDLNAGGGVPIPNGYGGFDWNNFDVLDSVTYTNPSGYVNGTVSQPNVAFNAFGDPASFSVASGTFTAGSFYLTAAWNNGLNVQVEGLLNGQVIDDTTFIVNATGGPTLETVNWSGINELYFDSFGGTNVGYNGSGEHFALDNLTIGAGAAIQTVSSGGTASFTVVGSGDEQIVLSGGTASAASIQSGGQEVVSAGGLDSGATVSSGGFEDVYGSAVATLVLTGGSQTVEAGGSVTGAVLDGAAVESVLGFAGGTVVGSGDEQLVESGGAASGTVISSGGSEVVSSGGLTSDTVIAGGILELQSGAAASGTISFAGSGGVLQLDSLTPPAALVAGLAGGDTIDLRAVAFGATASVTFDAATGALTVTSGGVSETLSLAGGTTATGFLLGSDGAGGTDVEPLASLTGLVLSAGQTLTISAGESVSGITVLSGAMLQIASGGEAVGTVISGGGEELVASGGLDSGATIASGGFEDVFGSAVATLVLNGGSQTVEAGGSVTGAVLDGVGLQLVLGFAGGTVVGAGDEEVVEPGGVASGTVISSGGLELVASGGVTRDTVVAGGMLDLADGAAATGAISFSGGGGELLIEGQATPAATVGLFAAGDVLDERAIPFAAGDTAKLDENDRLTVSGGGTSVSLQFDNAVAGAAFLIADDGSGGVLLRLTSDTTAPVTVAASLSVSAGASATAIGIAAPSDPDNAASALRISVTQLPSNGTVTLADGTSAVSLGEGLTLSQLTGLEFTPGTGAAGTSSTFGYSVSDPAGNTAGGVASLAVAGAVATRLYDFVFVYNGGQDYYLGTVADDGRFGYAVGQTTAASAGSYIIFGEEPAATSRAAGSVFVTDYSHGGPGAASGIPVKTAAGSADGNAGLGSESDTLLGVDGQPHPFSSTEEAAFPTTPLYGFVFTYADGASYSGTVAGSQAVTDAGNILGVYTIFSDGVTARPAGTVVIDRFQANGASVAANHTGAGAVDGTAGLGSEVGSVTVGEVTHSFSPTSEPVVTGILAVVSPPSVPVSQVIASEVDGIFYDILGRAPSPSEFATDSGALGGGTSAQDVRAALAAASEAQSDLQGLYQQIFGRAAATGELSAATSDLTDGSSLASLQQGLATSSEAAGDINQIYLDVLGRAADSGGLASFTAALGNERPGNLTDPGGLSGIAGVRDVLAHSGDAQEALTSLFAGQIGRDPSTAELVGMEDQLAIKGNTEATLESALRATGSAGGYTAIPAPGGNATLAAAAAPSLFTFSDIAFNDTITGFNAARDTIELPHSVAPDFTTIQSDTKSASGGSLITLNPNQSIFIAGIAPTKLAAGNFLLS